MTAASSMQLTLRRLSHAAASGSGSSIWAGRQAPGGPGLAQALLQQRGLASRASPSLQRSARGLLRDLKQLSKARLSALVVLTAAAGFAAGSGDTLDWAGMAWTCAGTFGAAACANTLNQVYEIANDRRMSRTCNRPLPAGRLGRLQALAFAATMGAGGLWILAEKVGEEGGGGAASTAPAPMRIVGAHPQSCQFRPGHGRHHLVQPRSVTRLCPGPSPALPGNP
jgi:hypothetical protein